MDSDKGGVDPNTIQTHSGLSRKALCRHQVQSEYQTDVWLWHVIFNEQFLADHASSEELRHFVEHKVIPKVLKNPGKRIQISKLGDITVEEKNPS